MGNPAPRDRAMTPRMIAEEYLPMKSPRWIIDNVPQDARVQVKSRPPLFWRSRIERWLGLAA